MLLKNNPITRAFRRVDAYLLCHVGQSPASRKIRLPKECCLLLFKLVRSCFLAGVFFTLLLVTPKSGLLGLPRYDFWLLIMLLVHIWCIKHRFVSANEQTAIIIFYLLGLLLEMFKTSAYIQSWFYQDRAYTMILGVPLVSGVMYACVGSFITEAWRFLKIHLHKAPPLWLFNTLSVLLYINFFTKHYIGDQRVYLSLIALLVFFRTQVFFTPYDRQRKIPFLLVVMLLGLILWGAENICTYFGVWHYSHQLEQWQLISLNKWYAWSLLIIACINVVVLCTQHAQNPKASDLSHRRGSRN